MAVISPDKTSTIPNYRQQLKKALPPEYLKPDHWNLLWFPFHFGVIGLCYWALHAHFSYWLAPIAALAIGHSFGCLGFLAHDVCHGGSVKNPIARDLLAGLGFSSLWIGPYLWRRWHNAEHHNNTQIEGLDPDHLFTMEDYQKNLILQALYALHPLARNIVIFSSFSYRMTQQSLRMFFTYLFSPKSTNFQRLVLIAELVVPLVAWVALSLSLGRQVLIWGYIIPVYIANAIVISYIATNHFLNPLADERDVLATSLSVTLPAGLRWLDPIHSYFGAHVAHHLFPGAPARYTRQIDAKAAELWPDRYHEMPITTALAMLWRTPWV